jgi:hypothetical protein
MGSVRQRASTFEALSDRGDWNGNRLGRHGETGCAANRAKMRARGGRGQVGAEMELCPDEEKDGEQNPSSQRATRHVPGKTELRRE